MSDAHIEEWRTVPSRPSWEVSSTGRVRRRVGGRGAVAGRMMRTPIDSEGYPTVNLSGKMRRVHTLVAEAFLGPIPKGAQVHHIDEDRANPLLSNLEVKPSQLAHLEEHRRSGRQRRRHGEPNPWVGCACGCGARFRKFDSGGRLRQYVHGHGARRAA